jgi:hypothetical protein
VPPCQGPIQTNEKTKKMKPTLEEKKMENFQKESGASWGKNKYECGN